MPAANHVGRRHAVRVDEGDDLAPAGAHARVAHRAERAEFGDDLQGEAVARVAASSAVPSVDPLSTTTTSKSRKVCAAKPVEATRQHARRSLTAMLTLTFGAAVTVAAPPHRFFDPVQRTPVAVVGARVPDLDEPVAGVAVHGAQVAGDSERHFPEPTSPVVLYWLTRSPARRAQFGEHVVVDRKPEPAASPLTDATGSSSSVLVAFSRRACAAACRELLAHDAVISAQLVAATTTSSVADSISSTTARRRARRGGWR